MDEDAAELIIQLCTRAGMLMEDACVLALTLGSIKPSSRRQVLEELVEALASPRRPSVIAARRATICAVAAPKSRAPARAYAASWYRERSLATASAYVPLNFAPGEAYQFDWSHEVVIIAGATTTVKVAHVRLCHSRMFYMRAYPRESQEMVFDAHDKAFVFFGSACQRGIYDNMKTAVDAIFTGRERRYNRRFEQMCGHYLVEPVA